jgi:hypothetical protein
LGIEVNGSIGQTEDSKSIINLCLSRLGGEDHGNGREKEKPTHGKQFREHKHLTSG